MITLLKSSSLSQLVEIRLVLCEFRRIDLLPRRRDWQQKVNRHAKCPRELLMKNDRTLALSRFEIGQVSLPNANSMRQLRLRHVAPLAQHANRIFSVRKPINNRLRQQDLTFGLHRGTRPAHQASGPNIFVGRQCRKPLVFTLGKNRELLTASGLDELNLSHAVLSVIDFTAVPDRNDDKRITLGIEDDAPVTDTQLCALAALEPPHVSLPRLSKFSELRFKAASHIGGEVEPLARRGSGPDDLHFARIAYSDNLVKINIALHEWGRVP
jgi:hypothetical protein